MDQDFRLHEPEQTGGSIGLGAEIKRLRKAAAMTQDGLAGRAFSKSYISAVERGKVRPSLKALHVIAQGLGTTAAALLGHDEQEGEPTATLLARAEAALLVGRPEATIELLASELTDPEQEAQSLLLRGRAYAALGKLEHAATLGCEVLALQSSLPNALLAGAHSLVGVMISGRTRAKEGVVEQEQALKLGGAQQHDVLRRLLADYTALANHEEVAQLGLIYDGELTGIIGQMAVDYARQSEEALEAGRAADGLAALAGARAIEDVRQALLLITELRLTSFHSRDSYPGAIKRLQQLDVLAALGGEPLPRAEVALLEARVYFDDQDPSLARLAANRALALVGAGGVAVEAHSLLAAVAEDQQRFDDADSEFQQALELAQQSGDRELISTTASAYAILLGRRGQHEAANKYYRIALGKDDQPSFRETAAQLARSHGIRVVPEPAETHVMAGVG